MELNQLNADEISKLKQFLQTIQDGSCSTAQSGTKPGDCFNFYSLTASKIIRDDT